MLFSSPPFLFCFLPLFLYFWHRLSTSSSAPSPLAALFLCASLIFYAFWGLAFLLLLLCLVTLNYLAALGMGTTAQNAAGNNFLLKIGHRRLTFICIICLNVLVLLWFKYSPFIVDNLALLFDLDFNFTPPGLPLGISFYTFIQIAWLHDVYSGYITRENYREHLLFSCGFPWLVSGPIVRSRELAGQLSNLSPLSPANCARGFGLFSIGLAKKLVLADSCGLYADNVFNAAASAWPVSCVESWAGSLFYTFQLYFDFSGYTDMALGLGLLMGLTLPENFNSPYRASGIIEFWRRWHITLGSWLRDFIYIPLGGNRKGKLRQYLNLFLTMLLGGIWHGAGWTYICWGAMHGLMLILNHAWRRMKKEKAFFWADSTPVKMLSICITFFCLNFCWVIFRASNLESAMRMYTSMFSPNLPHFADWGLSTLIPHHYISGWQPAFLLSFCALLCWTMPNSHKLLDYVFNFKSGSAARNPAWAFYFGLLAFIALLFYGRQSAFLYFQF